MTTNPAPSMNLRSTSSDDKLVALEVGNHNFWRQIETQHEEFRNNMEALTNAVA